MHHCARLYNVGIDILRYFLTRVALGCLDICAPELTLEPIKSIKICSNKKLTLKYENFKLGGIFLPSRKKSDPKTRIQY